MTIANEQFKSAVSLQTKRILVVEDDVANMTITSTLLRHAGATVIADHWNYNAKTFPRQYGEVDVILLDLMLRWGTSGYDIFQSIRSIPQLAHIPVIAVSASDPAVEIPRARALGFNGFISKPLNLHIFADQIAACMAGEPVWDGI